MRKLWVVVAALVSLVAFGRGVSVAGAAPGGSVDDLTFVAADGSILHIDMLSVGSAEERAIAVDATRTALLAENPGLRDITTDANGGWVEKGYVWTAKATAFRYNPAGGPPSLAGTEGAISDAANTWNRSGADFLFTDAGTSQAGTGACDAGGDGQNTIGWASLAGTLLALTCTLYTNDGAAVHAAIEFDTRLDPKWDWTTGAPNIDLQSVVTHELGHALGLGHSADPATVMFANITRGALKRELTSTDIGGAVAHYGAVGKRSDPVVALQPGLNLVWWSGVPTAAAAALPGGHVLVIYSFDEAASRWLRFVPGLSSPLNTLLSLEPGKAYWVLAADAPSSVTAP